MPLLQPLLAIKVKVRSYVARYPVTPVLGTVQSALHFTLNTVITDLFIRTPYRLLLEAFSHAAMAAQ